MSAAPGERSGEGMTPGTVAHYNLLERLGEGGLGEVFRARDTKFGRTVALKLGPPGHPDGQRRDRLLEDARAAAVLSHPNIATLFDFGTDEERVYFAYEFVQGVTLRQQLTGAPMNARHALDLAVQVADGVAEAHARGVLHRDLRPEIVVETPKGSAKILDFGMALWTRGGQARALAAAVPGSAAGAAEVVGYMSPEQVLGSRVDARTDVFSLAVIVYEMLTGRHPFAVADAGETLVNIAQKAPAAPTTLNAELPRMVDVVLSRALSKALHQRTESAARLASDLRRCRGLMDRGEPEGRARPSRPAEAGPGLLPIDEDRGGSGLWWLLAVLGAGTLAAVYYWMR